MKDKLKHYKFPLLVALLATFAVAGLGGLLTTLGPWYYGLQQPAWKPPDWLFGPVWTTIFVLIALAGATAWIQAPDRTAQVRILAAFGLNAVLNVLWSGLFFALQRPDWALYEIGPLWLSIALLIAVVGRYSRLAAGLLLPYLGWVGFAAALNYAVVRLNGPFG
ncbi:MAG: TspO/MBR family protein [Candidatus Competibacterales bacterium]|nr:TspO/MBR family protein [Candidatus Competibacterales bacterium]